jgi:thiol-disulfide isomerase/thioredoxin
MKKLFAILLLCMGSLESFSQDLYPNQFVLTGGILNAKSPFVYLLYTDQTGKEIKDSCLLQDGRFSFKGNINEPTWAIIKTNSKIMDDAINKNIADFFLEPVSMAITLQHDRFREIKISGSKTQEEYLEMGKLHSVITKNYTDSLYERHSKLTEQYIINHPDSYISAYELSFYKSRWPNNSVKYLYTKLGAETRNTFYGRRVKTFLDELDNNSEGKKATDFVATNSSGNTIQLSAFKEKYVLLDFWGSWCVPCRQSTPHLIELFKKYAAKGFNVIGIAEEYDKTLISWRNAITKDGVDIWNNILSNPVRDNANQSSKH